MRNHEFVPRPLRRQFSLSCVVPVYNEGELIAEFLQCLYKTIGALSSNVEVIVVNDGSSDNSAAEIARVAGWLPLHYIELSRNFGKELALQAGLDAANTDCVVILDADFQHPMTAIPEMVKRWQAGADMVYTTKANRDTESWLTKLGSALFYRLMTSSTGVRIPKDAGDFRLLDRKVVETLRAMPERNRFMKGMYAWVGFKSEAIEIQTELRPAGKSKFGALKLANLAMTGVTAFSNVPLRLVTGAGMVISLLSVLMGMWIVFERLFLHQIIPGFATLAGAIFFFAGIQLVALGIVGEYVGRIFDEVKQRPLYLIADRIKSSPLSLRAAVDIGPHDSEISVLGASLRRRNSDRERISV